MARFRRDEDGLDAVVSTILIVAIVVALVAGVFVFVNGFHSAVERKTVLYGLATDGADPTADHWTIKLHSVNTREPASAFHWVLTTPHNGTLVARPAPGAPAPIDVFWELGATAGTGAHRDNGSVVQTSGLGGFRLHFADHDADGLLSGGDRIRYTYDGDGDQGHAAGRDDPLPAGTYRFELLHVASAAIGGSVLREV